MPKLSDIQIDAKRFKGKGIRPWNDENVIKPANQTVRKLLADREQTVSRPLADREQTVSKPLADREQAKNKKTGSVSRSVSNTVSRPLADREQTVSRPLANYSNQAEQNGIEILVGKERDLLDLLFQKCQLTGSLVSPIITTDELKNRLKINAIHLRNLIYRMVKKEIIKVAEIKNGQASWRKFKFSKEIYQSLSLNHTVSRPLADREQTVSKPLAEALAEPLASPLSSSSNIYNITTTTEFPKEWLEISHASLSHIGFSQQHLVQLRKMGTFDPISVQDSIEHFSFDLSENNKISEIKTNPLGYFMGIMKRSGVYTAPENYEAPKDRAMRLYLEQQKTIQKKREVMENELLEISFSEWKGQLSEEEKNKLLPEEIKRINLSGAKESHLRQHFRETLWPEKRVKVLAEIEKKEN